MQPDFRKYQPNANSQIGMRGKWLNASRTTIYKYCHNILSKNDQLPLFSEDTAKRLKVYLINKEKKYEIPNQFNIADDILLGENQKNTTTTLKEVLHHLNEQGITVNPNNCIFDGYKRCTSRIENFIINLQGYDFELVHMFPTNLADYLSKHHSGSTGTSQTREGKIFFKNID